MADDNIEEFTLRVQGRPPELFDQIYQHVFTASPGLRFPGPFVKYTPLQQSWSTQPTFQGHDTAALLQVDRASRNTFAGSYYGGADTVFVFDHSGDLNDWIMSLNEAHRSFMRWAGLAAGVGVELEVLRWTSMSPMVQKELERSLGLEFEYFVCNRNGLAIHCTEDGEESPVV